MRILIYLIYALAMLCVSSSFARSGSDPIEVDSHYRATKFARYVNPLIGTVGEAYTYPGAVSPWGMVSASPHTTYTSQFDYLVGNTIAPAGYAFGKPLIDGFGQTHLSGVACNELGAPIIAATSGAPTPGNYASRYSEERARAGYYSVHLGDANTTIETTTTPRAAFYRFQFHNESKNYILLDASRNLSWISHKGHIERQGPGEYGGWSQTGNFCHSGNEQKVYFSIRVLSPTAASGTWQDGGDDINATASVSGDVGAWFEFDGAGMATVAIGVSYVSMENARENRRIEIAEKSFDTVVAENIQRWETQLEKIKINDPGKANQKATFYTALYHALLHPNIVSDINGDYPLYESSTKGSGNNKSHPRYGLFSLWDSYRNVHALLSLFYPEQQQGMLYTLEDMTVNAGHPPRWELYGSETGIMVGDPAQSVLAEGIVKGFDFKNPEKLFSALYKSATDSGSSWRPGNTPYLEKGYIPEDTDEVWGSVSTTLEYAYHDWALAQLAEHIGDMESATALRKQSLGWRALFDTQTGTVRPKTWGGKWLGNFDPAAMEDSWWISLVVKNHGGPGFVEGNAYQYTFMVPHDTQGLVELFGSIKAYADQLAYIFDNNHFTLWNEPNMAYPYLLGIDSNRQKMMQEILQKQRTNNFSNKEDGIPGNDDAGVLSAWYVFAMLGFYPANPASGDYLLGVPGFRDISLQFPATNSTMRIIADFNVEAEQWRSVVLDEKVLDGKNMAAQSVSHEQLQNAQSLLFSIK